MSLHRNPPGKHHIDAIMTLELTEDETRALAEHLKHAINSDPFPLSPRLLPLKAILAKLDPPQPRPEPLPPLRPGVAQSRGRGGPTMERLALIALCLAMLLAGCKPGNADAEFGPNPGGGYFSTNVNSGTVNPEPP